MSQVQVQSVGELVRIPRISIHPVTLVKEEQDKHREARRVPIARKPNSSTSRPERSTRSIRPVEFD